MNQSEILVRHLKDIGDWVPAHALIKVTTPHGFLGSSADRRARDLAEEGTILREDGGRIGKDKRFTYYKAKEPLRFRKITLGDGREIINKIY